MKAVAAFTNDVWEETPIGTDPSGASFKRTTIQKTFSGEIVGTSSAEMQMAGSASGAMAYCGYERFNVTIDGKKGTFVLKHDAGHSSAASSMELTVVEGFGAEDFETMTGSGQITQDDNGLHEFTLEYEL